jgi:hypothetical protein
VRCLLELRSPASGTGTGETWTFSGADGRALEACLLELDAFAVDPPLVRYSLKDGYEIEGDDRWRAAMQRWSPDMTPTRWVVGGPRRAEAAWTAEGALRLAELLPERLDDLREDILARFAGPPAP